MAVIASVGTFLFTRFIIPEAILALFLLIALYSLITGLELERPGRFYWMWAAVALALLTKGFIARCSLSVRLFPTCCSPGNGGVGAS